MRDDVRRGGLVAVRSAHHCGLLIAAGESVFRILGPDRIELAHMTETPTPATDAIYACASLLAKRLADEKARLRIQPLQ